jgi:hypothetical protein
MVQTLEKIKEDDYETYLKIKEELDHPENGQEAHNMLYKAIASLVPTLAS